MPEWIKPFPVMSVYRFDLYRISLTQEQVDAFTDEDMLKIANIVKIKYLEGGFYSHLLVLQSHLKESSRRLERRLRWKQDVQDAHPQTLFEPALIATGHR